jgi:hypothetical protein
MRTIRIATVALLMSARPVVAGGQADTLVLRLADSLTVGDYCRLARQIVADTAVQAKLGPNGGLARAHADVTCTRQAEPLSLLAVNGGASAPLKSVARLDNNIARGVSQEIIEAMRRFRSLTRDDAATRQTVAAALGEPTNAEWVGVAETARAVRLRDARDNALERLANYKRKLGPTSPKLNAPEVLLNFLAQRFIPGFRPSPLGGPSPWEVVASYSPAYATFGQDESAVLPVSASEFGLRFYLFGDRFGKPGIAGVFLPSYVSFGMLTASDRNGALVWPWRGHDRSGPFFSLGSIKIGYIARDRGTWLFSRQFQAIPFVF